jgi:hypothetical protein
VSHLLVIPQKARYTLNEAIDPEKDLFVFLVWSNGKNEPVPYYVPSDTPDESENGLIPNPDLQVVSAAFDNPGVQVVYVFYKMYNANYFVFVYDPNADGSSDGTGDDAGDGGNGGGGLDVTIDW